MPNLTWYLHRLRAMDPLEIGWHLGKKLNQAQDSKGAPPWPGDQPFPPGQRFPRLGCSGPPPACLLAALAATTDEILRGTWRIFSKLQIKVDDPPVWQKDYLSGQDLTTGASAFKLNHRQMPEGCDIKLIWEISRWSQLVRLAQAGHLLNHRVARETCIAWMQSWVRGNQPYSGWNWISPLEAGIRLVQFAWIDELLWPSGPARETDQEQHELSAAKDGSATLGQWASVRASVLPSHVWFTWRYHSRGSSANNHLIGELAGLILALTRWPSLSRWGVPVERLQKMWETEVLAQFAEDGGNREQALNYHLFSWEFCWQTRAALLASGRGLASTVEDRLQRAAEFFSAVQVENEPWDYGDSDNGFVTPFFAKEEISGQEWHRWMIEPRASRSIYYWLGDLGVHDRRQNGESASPRGQDIPGHAGRGRLWRIFSASGLAVARHHDWTLRWDLSPLGYLATAAHGHLDALHLSIWRGGQAFIIDPGTGAYYAEPALRNHLSSCAAHNGPEPAGMASPERVGPFLWSSAHPKPEIVQRHDLSLAARLKFPQGLIERTVTWVDKKGWEIQDRFDPGRNQGREFSVCWQFAPGTRIDSVQGREIRISRGSISVLIELSASWSDHQLVTSPAEPSLVRPQNHPGQGAGSPQDFPNAQASLRGTCSPSFRQVTFAPYLLLTGTGHKSCVFSTLFLASSAP